MVVEVDDVTFLEVMPLLDDVGIDCFILGQKSPITDSGQFDDWASISKLSDGGGYAGNPNIDLSEYATTEQSVLTCFYLKVEGDVLEGVAIPEPEARSRPSGDSIGEVIQDSGNQQSAPLPVDTSIDALFLPS